MEQKVFSVYDSKAKLWLQPFFARNAAVAVRMFEAAVREKDSNFQRYASDYSLFEIGSWSENDGVLLPHSEKVSLGVAVEFLTGGQ